MFGSYLAKCPQLSDSAIRMAPSVVGPNPRKQKDISCVFWIVKVCCFVLFYVAGFASSKILVLSVHGA